MRDTSFALGHKPGWAGMTPEACAHRLRPQTNAKRVTNSLAPGAGAQLSPGLRLQTGHLLDSALGPARAQTGTQGCGSGRAPPPAGVDLRGRRTPDTKKSLLKEVLVFHLESGARP